MCVITVRVGRRRAGYSVNWLGFVCLYRHQHCFPREVGAPFPLGSVRVLLCKERLWKKSFVTPLNSYVVVLEEAAIQQREQSRDVSVVSKCIVALTQKAQDKRMQLVQSR